MAVNWKSMKHFDIWSFVKVIWYWNYETNVSIWIIYHKCALHLQDIIINHRIIIDNIKEYKKRPDLTKILIFLFIKLSLKRVFSLIAFITVCARFVLPNKKKNSKEWSYILQSE